MSEFQLNTLLPAINAVAFTFGAFAYAWLTYMSAHDRSFGHRRWIHVIIFSSLLIVCIIATVGYWRLLLGQVASDGMAGVMRPVAWILGGFPPLGYLGIELERERTKRRALRLLGGTDGNE